MRPGRLWWLFQRDRQRGWAATFHAYRTLPKIERWHPVGPLAEAPPVSVHVFTGAEDWRLAAWTLASFTHFTQRAWRIFIHDDGTLPASAAATLQRLFSRVEIVDRRTADAALEQSLAPFPRCQTLRRRNVLAPKLFDPAHYSPAEKRLQLDSDVLFFQQPAALMEWAERGDGCWFNRDVNESTLVSAGEARSRLGIALWPRVNAGLSAVERSTVDYLFCEKVLAETEILQGHFWRIEQTLIALCASRGQGGLLPPSYEVSLARQAAPGVVARHYVGAVRPRFYAEGLARLQRELFPE